MIAFNDYGSALENIVAREVYLYELKKNLAKEQLNAAAQNGAGKGTAPANNNSASAANKGTAPGNK